MKKALIVGMEKCVDAAIGVPPHAVADAVALAEMLGDACGFEDVRLLESPSREELLDTAADMAGSLGLHDSFLFVFFGRGFASRHGDLSLVCADDRLDALQGGEGGVSVHILETVTRKNGVNRAFFVAASAPDLNGGGGKFGLYGKFPEVVFPEGEETHVMLCQSGRLPADSDCIGKEHGVFAEALLDILRENGPEPLDIGETFGDAFALRTGEVCANNGLSRLAPLFRLSGVPFPLVGDAGAECLAREEAERLAREEAERKAMEVSALRVKAEALRAARELLVRTLAARERELARKNSWETVPCSPKSLAKQSSQQPQSDSSDPFLHRWELHPRILAAPQSVPEPGESVTEPEIRGWTASTTAVTIWGINIVFVGILASGSSGGEVGGWFALFLIVWVVFVCIEAAKYNSPKKGGVAVPSDWAQVMCAIGTLLGLSLLLALVAD